MNHVSYPPFEPRRTLILSVIDASFYYIMFGFGEAYFAAYLLWLKAPPLVMGLMMTLPILVGSVLQFFTPFCVRFFGSRKKFIMIFASLQGLCYLPILAASYLENGAMIVFALIVLNQVLFRMHVPAWNSMMGDHVKEESIGDYFGFHKRVSHTFILASSVLAGLVMAHFQKNPDELYTGYCIVFGIAFLARMISVILLNQHYERPLRVTPFTQKKWLEGFKKARLTLNEKLIFYYSLISFGQYMAVPYFSAYMLQVMELSYFDFSILTALVMGGRVLFSPAWGQILDEYGCRNVILVTSFGIAALSGMWALGENFIYICFVQLLSGFFWSGFELAWFQIFTETTPSHERTQVYALQQFFGGLLMVLGAVIGGLWFGTNPTEAKPYIHLFWASFVFRFLTAALFYKGSKNLTIKHRLLRKRDFASTFFRAFLDRGAFYVPEVLKASSKNSQI